MRSGFLGFAHALLGKPVPTFPGRALDRRGAPRELAGGLERDPRRVEEPAQQIEPGNRDNVFRREPRSMRRDQLRQRRVLQRRAPGELVRRLADKTYGGIGALDWTVGTGRRRSRPWSRRRWAP